MAHKTLIFLIPAVTVAALVSSASSSSSSSSSVNTLDSYNNDMTFFDNDTVHSQLKLDSVMPTSVITPPSSDYAILYNSVLDPKKLLLSQSRSKNVKILSEKRTTELSFAPKIYTNLLGFKYQYMIQWNSKKQYSIVVKKSLRLQYLERVANLYFEGTSDVVVVFINNAKDALLHSLRRGELIKISLKSKYYKKTKLSEIPIVSLASSSVHFGMYHIPEYVLYQSKLIVYHTQARGKIEFFDTECEDNCTWEAFHKMPKVFKRREYQYGRLYVNALNQLVAVMYNGSPTGATEESYYVVREFILTSQAHGDNHNSVIPIKFEETMEHEIEEWSPNKPTFVVDQCPSKELYYLTEVDSDDNTHWKCTEEKRLRKNFLPVGMIPIHSAF